MSPSSRRVPFPRGKGPRRGETPRRGRSMQSLCFPKIIGLRIPHPHLRRHHTKGNAELRRAARAHRPERMFWGRVNEGKFFFKYLTFFSNTDIIQPLATNGLSRIFWPCAPKPEGTDRTARRTAFNTDGRTAKKPCLRWDGGYRVQNIC